MAGQRPCIKYALALTIFAQAVLCFFAYLNGRIMAREWPDAVGALDKEGASVFIVQDPDFWGPVEAIVLNTCNDVEDYDDKIKQGKSAFGAAKASYKVGDRVEGLYSNGLWYPATVSGLNSDGSYTVAWDNGRQTRKNANELRPPSQGAERPPASSGSHSLRAAEKQNTDSGREAGDGREDGATSSLKATGPGERTQTTPEPARAEEEQEGGERQAARNDSEFFQAPEHQKADKRRTSGDGREEDAVSSLDATEEHQKADNRRVAGDGLEDDAMSSLDATEDLDGDGVGDNADTYPQDPARSNDVRQEEEPSAGGGGVPDFQRGTVPQAVAGVHSLDYDKAVMRRTQAEEIAPPYPTSPATGLALASTSLATGLALSSTSPATGLALASTTLMPIIAPPPHKPHHAFNVTMCGLTIEFWHPHFWHRYFSMITLARLLHRPHGNIMLLRLEREFLLHQAWPFIFVCMLLKYSMQIIDTFTRSQGHEYMQIWNGGRTTFDRVLESFLLHGVSIVFTLSLQLTICNAYFTFWNHHHFLMICIPVIGFKIFFYYMCCFSVFMLIDRCYACMEKKGNWLIYTFWSVWVICWILVTLPMTGYVVYSLNFMYTTVNSHMITEEVIFSDEFMKAAAGNALISFAFLVVAIIDFFIIMLTDFDQCCHNFLRKFSPQNEGSQTPYLPEPPRVALGTALKQAFFG